MCRIQQKKKMKKKKWQDSLDCIIHTEKKDENLGGNMKEKNLGFN